jgi:hypothetical protein
MRLWSLHPKYLDPQGLVALWREALLAQAVLRGATRGYRNHPQLERFRAQESPVEAIGSYLAAVQAEAGKRGYAFDRSKIVSPGEHPAIAVTRGQIEYEREHLLRKLAQRNPDWLAGLGKFEAPRCHPLFKVRAGPVESWERT